MGRRCCTARRVRGPITQFDAAEFPVQFACEAKDFDPANWIDRKQSRRMTGSRS